MAVSGIRRCCTREISPARGESYQARVIQIFFLLWVLFDDMMGSISTTIDKDRSDFQGRMVV